MKAFSVPTVCMPCGAGRRSFVKKKTACTIGAAALAICAAGGYFFYSREKGSETQNAPALPDGMELSEDAVAATGLTSVGMLEEIYELGFLEDGLYVEETWLNMGDEVEAGTAVFKVSDESLQNARRELEKQVQETELNRRQGAITYESGMLDAQKEKELAAVEANYAQAIYDSEVADAQQEVDALQEKVDEAQEKVEEYTASIEEDYYYTYYEVAEKEATWKDNAAFLMELYTEWNVEALESIYGGSGGKNGIGYVTNQVSASGGASSQSGGASTGTQAGSGGGDAPGTAFSRETVTGVYFTQENTAAADLATETAAAAEDGSEDNTVSGTDNAGAGSAAAGSAGSADSGGGSAATGSTGSADSGGDSTATGSTGSADTGSGSTATGSTDSADTGSGSTADGTADAGDTSEEEDGSAGAEETEGGSTEEEEPISPDGADRFTAPGGGGFGGSVSGNDIGMGGGITVGDDEIRYNIYLAMEEEAEESEQAYETALENYENAKKTAEAGIEEAKSELAVLQAQLKEQQAAYEEAVLSAKLTYDLAISDNENAEMVYESTVKQLEEEYEALQEAEESAAENLALFEETLGDGFFYTSASGTVMMTMVRASQWLTEDTVVIAYSNPDTVTIAASVDQEDIASVEIGQEAFVAVSGYGTYTGRVTSINPVSSSTGSSVSYTVNVQLEGDVSALEANLTAYVYLGLSEEERALLENSASGQGRRGSGDGSLPEGAEGTEGGMPEGAEGTEGIMPEGADGVMPEDMEGGMPGGAGAEGERPAGNGEGGRSNEDGPGGGFGPGSGEGQGG